MIINSWSWSIFQNQVSSRALFQYLLNLEIHKNPLFICFFTNQEHWTV